MRQKMKTEDKISIQHSNITFFKRVRYYLQTFFGIISLMILFLVFKEGPTAVFFSFILIMCLFFGLLIGLKIYKTKLYLTSFYSDSYRVEICYLNCSEEQTILSTIEKIEIKLKNTSSRAGFDCEIEIIIDNKKFIINDDFDWGFSEMKTLFEYIKSHKQEILTEKEKFIISRIEEKLKRNPF
jgi:hypothetical protein